MLYTHAAAILGKGLPNLQRVVNYRAGRAIERTEGVNRGHRQEKEALLRFTSCRRASRERDAPEQRVAFNELIINGDLWPVPCVVSNGKHSVTKFAHSFLSVLEPRRRIPSPDS